MKQKGNYLFVYGTLLDGSNEFAAYLRNNCSFHNIGKLRGRLYDIGEYPGAIVYSNYPDYIHGSIFLMNDYAKVLPLLDDYEGFGDDQQQPNLFIREMLDIETDKGLVNCWVYLYNLTVDGLKLIESGDYLKYRS